MEPIETLVANHRRFLAFLERRTGDRTEAEDILQEAFVRGIEHVEGVRDEESVIAWFFRVLRNALVDRSRRHAAEARSLERIVARIGATDPESEREACACIGALLSQLNPDYAELIRRVDLEGEPVTAWAAAKQVTAGSARVRLHRARAALRREVERTCRTCAEHGCMDCTCRSGHCG